MMSAVTLKEIEQDSVAMSIAKALKLANTAVVAHGTEPVSSAITISAETSEPASIWPIHYGPRDDISRRGDDLTVTVDAEHGRVEQVLCGQ